MNNEQLHHMNENITKLQEQMDRYDKIKDQIEKSAAAIIAELTAQNLKLFTMIEKINIQITQCSCNREILDYLRQQEKTEEIQSEEKETTETTLVIPMKLPRPGWYPDNLKLGKEFVLKTRRYD